MFSLLRTRSAVLAPRAALAPRVVLPRSPALTAFRNLSSSAVRKASDHEHHDATPPTPLYGEGAPPGQVPTDLDQATGLERLQLLGQIEGVDVFDMKPLGVTRLGTMDDPIMVQTLTDERIIGCTGFPADSHDTIWLAATVHGENRHRCPECGCVYSLRDLRVELEELAGTKGAAKAH